MSLLGRPARSLAGPALAHHTRPSATLGAFRSWARRYRTASGKVSAPLRILFCGSDTFSCASLAALHDEHARSRELIRSIDVVVRPPKRAGRGGRSIQEVPLQSLATTLGLPVHVRDTFTGWDMPAPGGEAVNLIVAVSFGLFVPPRLLRAAQYGGLNVHPSLLPDLRGPAPLHHAILQNLTHTGVSLQTLSEKSFDTGIVLAQTPAPGLPIAPDATFEQLQSQYARLGSQMLADGLRAGVHVPPHVSAGWWQPHLAPASGALRHAPKLGTADRQVRWVGEDAWSAADVVRRLRAMRPLWTRGVGRGGMEKRVHFDGEVVVVPREEWPAEVCEFMRNVDVQARGQEDCHHMPGVETTSGIAGDTAEVKMVTWVQENKSTDDKGALVTERHRVTMPYFTNGTSIILLTAKGDCIRVPTLVVEGDKSKPAAIAIRAFAQA